MPIHVQSTTNRLDVHDDKTYLYPSALTTPSHISELVSARTSVIKIKSPKVGLKSRG